MWRDDSRDRIKSRTTLRGTVMRDLWPLARLDVHRGRRVHQFDHRPCWPPVRADHRAEVGKMNHTAANLAAALKLAASGIAVFPALIIWNDTARKLDKKPAITGWQANATTDKKQIEEWWQTFGDAVPGIELGRIGLVAIDLDRHEGGPDGVAAFQELRGRRRPDSAPVIRTPSGGFHVYYQQPNGEPLGNRTGALPPGVDVRGAGGWTVAPGAVCAWGKWQDAQNPLTKFFKAKAIPVLPALLTSIIRASRANSKPATSGAATANATSNDVASTNSASKWNGKREAAYARNALDAIASELGRTSPGSRNNDLNVAAFKMGTMVAPGWIDKTAVVDALWKACETNGLAAEGADAVQKTLASGINAGMKEPHAALPDREPDRRTNGGEPPTRQEASTAESEPPKTNGGDDSDSSGEPRARLSNFIFFGDAAPEPQMMLIDGVMPLQGLPFIGGQSSAGKTFVAILLACCAASGSPFMGHEVRQRVGSVIVAAEGRSMLAARIAAALQKLGVTEPVPISWVKQVPDFSRSEAITEFVEDLRAISERYQTEFGIPLGLVFVDTVSASFDIKEEADNAEAARVCKIMRSVADRAETLVVPIHHYGKNAGVGLRGASAWRANADFVLSVMADIDPQTGNVTNRQLAIAKDRDGAQGPLTPFELEAVDLGVDEDGKPWGSLAAVAGSGGAQSAMQWPSHLRVFRQALSNALIDFGSDQRPFPDGPQVRAVSEDKVREEFDRIAHVDSPPEKRQEALRKQFSRKLSDAQGRTLIGLHVDAAGHAILWIVSGKEANSGRPDTKSFS
jgi:hypothetical protein